MAGKTFSFRLVTPSGKLLDTQVEAVQFPAHDGLVGVLAGRAPLVMKLGYGPLRVDFAAGGAAGQSGTKTYFIEDGFAQMVANKLTVLTPKATTSEDLTEASVAAELKAIEAQSPTDEAGKSRQRQAVTHAKTKLAAAKTIRSK